MYKLKARLLFSFDMRVARETGEGGIVVSMRVHEVVGAKDDEFPDGLKFRWIAFDEADPEMRVLVDCHSGKGPHVHVDADTEGRAFVWTGIDDAVALFVYEIEQRFGVRIEIPL
ncbi:MAG: hypothetical protein JST16_02960 [Bdellovibrionales bacterium]|nr:hypothetical protein [Bdellovibrionales bacterium]